jgi:choline dehydrogenase-like flavoprotein
VDVVIVGSGAAGAAAADVFSEYGLRVLILDEGHVHPPSSFRAPMRDALGTLYRSFGAVPARGRSIVPLLQAKAVGGTTLVNGGITWRLPESVHREWVEAGVADGLSWAALQQEYDVLDRLLGVTAVPEVLLGGNGGLMARATERLGMEGRAIRRNSPGCQGAARCTQGCPHGAKASMDRTLLPRACARGAAILPGARVERVERRGGRARGVVGRLVDRAGRRVGEFRALAEQAVVLAASATSTPVLLARSNAGGRGMGRGFMAHPGLGIVGLFPHRVGLGSGATQAWESGHFRERGLKFETLSMPPSLLLSRMPGIGAELARSVDVLQRMACWGIQVRASAEGTVRPGWFGPRIRYSLGAQDVGIAAVGVQVAARMMFEAGAEAVFCGIHGLPDRITSIDQLDKIGEVFRDPRQAHFIATHLFGGARRGPDEQVHPVGLDFQVRDLPGAYVLDSSIFPANLGVNPQHTILAVARLGARRIAESLRR